MSELFEEKVRGNIDSVNFFSVFFKFHFLHKKDDLRRDHLEILIELLAEVSFQQSGEGLSMSRLVPCHFI